VLGINTARYYYHQAAMRLYGPGAHVVAFDGVDIALDFAYANHRSIYLRGEVEPALTQVLEAAVRPGDVFVDIGANFGWYTNWLLVKQPALNAVYAFEPLAAIFDLLKRSLSANRCEARCVAQQLAVGAKPGTLSIKKFAGLDPMHASFYPLADLPFEEEEVCVEPLDALAH